MTRAELKNCKGEHYDRIRDAIGTIRADDAVVRAKPRSACSVVTLGADREMKVDANYGAIEPSTY